MTAPLSVRSRAWPQWRVHSVLLSIGAVAGIIVAVWDLSYATKCLGPMMCIDFSGVALGAYWAVFGAQAVVSSTLMVVFRRSPRKFFTSHIISAAAVLVLVVAGVCFLFSTIPRMLPAS